VVVFGDDAQPDGSSYLAPTYGLSPQSPVETERRLGLIN